MNIPLKHMNNFKMLKNFASFFLESPLNSLGRTLLQPFNSIRHHLSDHHDRWSTGDLKFTEIPTGMRLSISAIRSLYFQKSGAVFGLSLYFLQETNICHEWERKLIFPTAFGWDMLVSRRAYQWGSCGA